MPSGGKKGAKYSPVHTRGWATCKEFVDGRGDMAGVVDQFAAQLAPFMPSVHPQAFDEAQAIVAEIARHLLYAASVKGLEVALEEIDQLEYVIRHKRPKF